MVPPTRFLRLIEHIRTRFDLERGLSANPERLCARSIPGAVCSAAVAALVNAGFLRWTADAQLVRSDADVEPPSRRTA